MLSKQKSPVSQNLDLPCVSCEYLSVPTCPSSSCSVPSGKFNSDQWLPCAHLQSESHCCWHSFKAVLCILYIVFCSSLLCIVQCPLPHPHLQARAHISLLLNPLSFAFFDNTKSALNLQCIGQIALMGVSSTAPCPSAAASCRGHVWWLMFSH